MNSDVFECKRKYFNAKGNRRDARGGDGGIPKKLAEGIDAMNWRRGLFRLWVIGTVLFVMAVAMVAYDDVKAVIAYGDIKAKFDTAEAKFDAAKAGNDATNKPLGGEWATPSPVTDPNLIARLNTRNAADEARFDADRAWANTEYLAGIAFGVPLAVLALGASLVWAFSGFSAKRP